MQHAWQHGPGARALVALAAALCLAGAAGAEATEVRVASSGGFAAAWRALAPVCGPQAQLSTQTVWGPSMGTTPEAIPQRLARGEPLDLLIMVDDALEALAGQGLADAASKRVLGRSLVAMAVRAGSPHPDIGSAEALRASLLAARSVAYSDSASGVYLSTRLFPRLGVAEALRAKATMIPAEPVGRVVARGDAEIGFQQLSELLPIPGIDIVGVLPMDLQQVTAFSAAVVKGSPNADAARRLIQCLASADAAATIRQTGLEPASPAASAP